MSVITGTGRQRTNTTTAEEAEARYCYCGGTVVTASGACPRCGFMIHPSTLASLEEAQKQIEARQ